MMTELIFFAFLLAFGSHFYDMLMWEDMIFEKWGKFLENLPKWIGKPLGSCIYCSNVWLTLIIGVFFVHWTCLPALVVMSNIIMRMVRVLLKNE